jgi:hypothetical protein
MLRLVQGDVGSGKTIVAALAAADAVETGHQAALMAPTELLAEQHAQNFTRWLAPLGLAPLLLTAALPAKRAARGRGRARRRQPGHRHRHPCALPGGRAIPRISRSSSWMSSIASACTSACACARRVRRAATRTS